MTAPTRGQRLTAAMLVATTLYLGLGYWTGQGARKAYASQLEQGRELSVLPTSCG